ncbi:hypothetical protein RFI_10369 [Reticulomyxa filosa]|uniref:C3H1-type domain-containing protein n=1 Tax=Reticulomyxa filosa TaxID=46433 RepID=X6NKC1_RETFI|nr:hypothetical protein RFI_10369 [Reticulomyxa filosa]|eukprot:ETO26765.1 hypothetical protein RFI_10369 [Reticulomyxa filosa]
MTWCDYAQNNNHKNYNPTKYYRHERVDFVELKEDDSGVIFVYGWYEPLTDEENHQICWEWGNQCTRGINCNWRHWDAQHKRDILTKWRPTGFYLDNDTTLTSKREDPPRKYGPTENDPTVLPTYFNSFLNTIQTSSKSSDPSNKILNEEEEKTVSYTTKQIESMRNVLIQVYTSLKKLPQDKNKEMEKIFTLFETVNFVLPKFPQ